MKHHDPYLPAKALGITKAERQALIDVATELATGVIQSHQFNMGFSTSFCGTRHCIGGWMAVKLGFAGMHSIASFMYQHQDGPLKALFYPATLAAWSNDPQLAARVCFGFLSTGRVNWP